MANYTKGGSKSLPRKKKTHCKRNHERTPENVNAQGSCRQCLGERDRTHERKSYLKYTLKKYGLTVAEYDALVAQQGGVCAICRRHNGDSRLAVDHCHRTGRVRGLLCTRCNVALGMVDDDINLLAQAIEYLQADA